MKRKIEIDNEHSHKTNSVLRGYGPHKLLEMLNKQGLENSKGEKKNGR